MTTTGLPLHVEVPVGDDWDEDREVPDWEYPDMAEERLLAEKYYEACEAGYLHNAKSCGVTIDLATAEHWNADLSKYVVKAILKTNDKVALILINVEGTVMPFYISYRTLAYDRGVIKSITTTVNDETHDALDDDAYLEHITAHRGIINDEEKGWFIGSIAHWVS